MNLLFLRKGEWSSPSDNRRKGKVSLLFCHPRPPSFLIIASPSKERLILLENFFFFHDADRVFFPSPYLVSFLSRTAFSFA